MLLLMLILRSSGLALGWRKWGYPPYICSGSSHLQLKKEEHATNSEGRGALYFL